MSLEGRVGTRSDEHPRQGGACVGVMLQRNSQPRVSILVHLSSPEERRGLVERHYRTVCASHMSTHYQHDIMSPHGIVTFRKF
eukprot:3902499-Amphidinium_carterae.1